MVRFRWALSAAFFFLWTCVFPGPVLSGADSGPVLPGASRTELYYPLLEGKRIGLVSNQTGLIPVRQDLVAVNGADTDTVRYVHLLDTLLAAGFDVCRLFSPEHGFRGESEAGERVDSRKDSRTGLPVISLYGSHKKPSSQDLAGLDIVLFDLQDVGVRFYTYVSTLHYVMEACAEEGIPVVVLDRPNPHVGYVDGPVLDTSCCRSFVGMHPVPLVYGMTIGEYARMIRGEGWLNTSVPCRLAVIPVANYDRARSYRFPVWPSPNLRSMEAVYAYPSLCLLEGTPVSMGRGTWHPFECYGFSGCQDGDFQFTPHSIPGLSVDPPYKGKMCTGYRIRFRGDSLPSALDLEPLLRMYRAYPEKESFFRPFFSRLAGTRALASQIRQGKSIGEIRASWQPGLERFLEVRQKYLLYK